MMREQALGKLALSLFLIVLISSGGDQKASAENRVESRRKVLVELYSSQGCSSCPPATDLVGRFPAMGFGDDKVVAINFHVDYFNEPWVDPYSDAAFTARQGDYNKVLHRTDLSFTPLMMVDGQYPLVGSDRIKATAAIKRALETPADVGLGLKLEGAPGKKSLAVVVSAQSTFAVDRALMVGVALTEDHVTTRVKRGENAGKTLVEHGVVRWFGRKHFTLDHAVPQTLEFPIELPNGVDPAGLHVAVFVQDRSNGRVYQADSIPWISAKSHVHRSGPSAERIRDLERVIADRKARKLAAPALDLFSMPAMGSFIPSDNSVPTICQACGSPFIPPAPPLGPFITKGGRATRGPVIITTC